MRLLALFACVLLAGASGGCATRPAFSSSWYLIEIDPPLATASGTSASSGGLAAEVKKPLLCGQVTGLPPKSELGAGLYIALVNQSTKVQDVTRVALNQVDDRETTPWVWTPAAKTTSFGPGQVIVLHGDDFCRDSTEGRVTLADSNCELPVSLIVTTTLGGPIQLAPLGTLPSSLPLRWVGCLTGKYVKATATSP